MRIMMRSESDAADARRGPSRWKSEISLGNDGKRDVTHPDAGQFAFQIDVATSHPGDCLATNEAWLVRQQNPQ
jgi:hypothetical protein